MSQIPTQMVTVDQIDPAEDQRAIVQTNIDKLVESIELVDGLLQPIGIIPVGDRYRISWGTNRLEAHKRLGRLKIEARVLPPDTTPEQEMVYSLQENHIRAAESFEDTLVRVESLAQRKKCSFAKAAETVGVTGTFVSKAQAIRKNLCPKAKKLVQENEVGIGILYSISSLTSESDQLRLLGDYLKGNLNRDQLDRAIKKLKGKQPRRLSVSTTLDQIGVVLKMPASITYEQIFEALSKLKKIIASHSKQNIPVRLLSDVME